MSRTCRLVWRGRCKINNITCLHVISKFQSVEKLELQSPTPLLLEKPKPLVPNIAIVLSPPKMPITMQKRRYPKPQLKETITFPHEKEQNSSCLSLNRVPVALMLLFLVFLWSSSTTFISGSIFHVCVSSRKLNNHLFCLTAGAQPSNRDIPQTITTVEVPPSVPISAVLRTPLTSLSNSAEENISIKNNVKAPLAVAIQLPSGGGGEKKETLDDATRRPLSSIIQLPRPSNSNVKPSSDGQRKAVDSNTHKTDSIIRLPVMGLEHPSGNEGGKSNKNLASEITSHGTKNESTSTTNSASIMIREKIEEDTKKEALVTSKKDVEKPTKESSSSSALVTAEEKMEKKNKEEEIILANKDAEEQMEVLRSYNNRKHVNYSNPEACDGRRIFVYDLPAKFNKELLGHCNEMITWLGFCKFLSNNAFGEPVPQLGDGWYNTHQYSLEPIFHARVLKHPCRVHNPEEAKIFYVPYYGGLDILRWHFKKNITLQLKDKLSYELIEWLSQQASWNKNFGLDHLFVLGKISWDFRRMQNFTWGTHFLDMDEVQNPMKLLIERHPWHINDIGVPHPSFFHPRSDNDIFAWQRKLMQMPRKHLVSFAGAPRPKARESIRSILIEQCTSSPDKCRFFDCREGRCTQPAPMVQLFTESEFCLQPTGDSPTRKSVFDSLVAGCIPVLFSPFTTYYQYPWHLPADRANYSVFVDEEVVRRRQVNIVDRLAAISATRRAEMRRYIVYELLPGLVYADPEAKLEKFEDGFSVAMNSVLERMSRLP